MGTHPIFESDFDCLTEKMSEEKALGLTEAHQIQIRELLRYSRFKRSERLIGIELCFQDFIETRIYEEDTYTQDEVREMLENLGKTVKDECESEFIHSSDTSALLMRQMMIQADKWKLRLQCDVQQLENRALLQLIRDFEKMESNLTAKSVAPQKLTPLQSEGPAQLLQSEIDRLQSENRELREKNSAIESRLGDALSEKNKAQSDLKSISNSDGNELQKMKSELLQVREELALKEKELDAKFRETAAYKNMKTLIEKKNSQIKELRSKVTEGDGDNYLKE